MPERSISEPSAMTMFGNLVRPSFSGVSVPSTVSGAAPWNEETRLMKFETVNGASSMSPPL